MFKEFFRAMFSRWLTALSGPLSVVPAFLSVYASNDFAKIAYGGLALAGLLLTSYVLWRNERLRVIELERALDPKLTIQFIPGKSPFVTETRVDDSDLPPEFKRALFFRVLPQCNAQTDNCIGVLKGSRSLTGMSGFRPHTTKRSLSFGRTGYMTARFGLIHAWLSIWTCSISAKETT